MARCRAKRPAHAKTREVAAKLEDPEEECEEGEVTTGYFGAIEEDDDPEDPHAKRMRLSGATGGSLRVSTRRTRSGGAGAQREVSELDVEPRRAHGA